MFTKNAHNMHSLWKCVALQPICVNKEPFAVKKL
jgi:hypothetical protein